MSDKKIPVSFIFKGMDRTSRPLGKIENKFKGVARSASRFNSVFKRSARLAGLNAKKFQKLSNNLNKVQKGFKQLAPLARNVALAGAISGIGLGIATKDAAQFEQQMSVVKSLTGDISKKEFAAMGLQAKKMGALTSFSAQDSAKALEYLSLAGFKPQESIGSLEKVLRVAEAGSLDLGLASDILTDSSSALGASFDKNMGKVQRLSILSDQFAAVQAKSNTNIEQLGEAVGFGGSALANMGIPLNQILAGFGKLADAKLKGSMAGTSMANMFETLAKPSDRVTGIMAKLGLNMKKLPLNDMPTMLTQIEGALNKLENGNYKTALMTDMFGVRGKRAYLALKEAGVESLKTLSGELKNSNGTAEKMAKERLNNFAGKFVSLKSALQGISIEIGDMIIKNKFLNKGFDKLVWFTQTFAQGLMVANGYSFFDVFGKKIEQVSPQVRKILMFAMDFKTGITDAFNSVIGCFYSIRDTFKSVTKMFGIGSSNIGVLIGKFIVWSAVLAPVIAGIAGVGLVVGSIVSGIGGVISIVTGAIGVFTSLASIISGVISFGTGFVSILLAITGPVGLTIAAVGALGAGIYALYSNWDGVCSFISEKWNWLTSLLPDSIKSAMGIEVKTDTKAQKNKSISVQKTLHQIQMGKAAAQKNELRVKFDNAPKGTRIEPERVESNLNLDLGFAMGGL